MAKKHLGWYAAAAGTFTLASLILVLVGEVTTVLAWWLMSTPLAIIAWLARDSSYLSLRVICALSLSTQIITVPAFFVNRFDYQLVTERPFAFTVLATLPIAAKASVFMLLVFVFYRLTEVCLRPVPLREPSDPTPTARWVATKSRSPRLYSLVLLATVMLAVPLNVWMFRQGIAIVGVEPPRLPFQLSGALHYVVRFVLPVFLAFVYLKSGRGPFPSMLMLSYGTILGLTTLSRSSMVLVLLPVLTVSWLERRPAQAAIAAIVMLTAFGAISQARNFVYLVVDGISAAVTDMGITGLIAQLSNVSDQLHPIRLMSWLVALFDRVEGFGNLVLASSYDPRAVIGGFGFVLRMIWQPLAPLDLDRHHLQWQGYVLPEGYVNGGALLSNALIASNETLAWLPVMALLTTLILITLEHCIRRIAKAFRTSVAFQQFGTGILTIIFFIEGGGSVIFVFPLAAVGLLALVAILVSHQDRQPALKQSSRDA